MSLLLFGGGNALDFSFTGSGGLAFAGDAGESNEFVWVGTGGLTLSGSAAMEFQPGKPKGHKLIRFNMTGSGGIVFGGSTSVITSFELVGSGGIVFDGSAPFEVALPPPPFTYEFVGSGSLLFAGVAEIEASIEPAGSGGLVFGGAALHIFVTPLSFDAPERVSTVAVPRVYIHYPHYPGHVLRELVSVQEVDRGFAAMDARQAAFSLAAGDADEDLLQPGNRIAITSPYFEPWVGYIVPVRHEQRAGLVNITALDVLAILDQRNVPGYVQYVKPIGSSTVVRELLEMANDRFYTGILPAPSLAVGPSIESLTPGGQSVLSALQEVCSRTGLEIWLEHEIDTNHIETLLHFGTQGEDVSERLHLFDGVHFADMTHARDGSPVKQVEEVYGEFGMEMIERAPVTRTTLAAAARGMGGSIEQVVTLSLSAQNALPPGLITERVTIDPMAVTASMRDGRAQRNQEYALPTQEQFDDLIAIPALSETQLGGLRVGNTWTRHGHFGSAAMERKVRIRGVQPTEYEGTVRLASWGVLE